MRAKTKTIKVQGEEILAYHVYLMLNDSNVITYKDFMNRVTNNWKTNFRKGELYDYVNIPRGEI